MEQDSWYCFARSSERYKPCSFVALIAITPGDEGDCGARVQWPPGRLVYSMPYTSGGTEPK